MNTFFAALHESGSGLRSYAENDAQRPLLEVKADTLLRCGNFGF
jgi:hypothetical protein